MNRIMSWISVSDTQAFYYINQQLRCRLFDLLMPKITHLGGATATISALLIVMVSFAGIARFLAIQALLSLTISHLIVHFIKKNYCRQRPYAKLINVTLSSEPLKDYSFPSGHSTAAFSVATVFAMYSLPLAVLLLPAAALISFSRMYLGLHYPTDCVIGALIGMACSVVIVLF